MVSCVFVIVCYLQQHINLFHLFANEWYIFFAINKKKKIKTKKYYGPFGLFVIYVFRRSACETLSRAGHGDTAVRTDHPGQRCRDKNAPKSDD